MGAERQHPSLCLSGWGFLVLPIREALTLSASKTYGKLTKKQEWHMALWDLTFILFPDSLRGISRGWPEGEAGDASSPPSSACPAHGPQTAFFHLSFLELDQNTGLAPGPGTLFLLSFVFLAEKSQSR